ncbi:hypothetical protein [Ideonella oryzae]|uniref:Alpha/beta hydrolase n=1 Tax=Ideonella oryzae TaxID=2937441 RepID=A0ABT1BSD0_9BURK|nr:hypothetical protein [Ideonella oryzae]MCO5979127.1 hypothetical protein [Ideonella oryzae]
MVQPARSRAVVVCFNWGKFQTEGDRFYADELICNLRMSAVGIVSKRPHWYLCDEWPQALAAAREAMASHVLKVGYGYSMGAYAALKHSKALGLDRVLAFSPQWSVDPEEAPWDERKDWAFTPSMKGMGVRAGDRAGRAYLFVDPGFALDWWHVERLLPAGDNVLVPMRHCGHDTMRMLTGRESMGPILQACLHAKPADALDIVRRRRRLNTHFRAYLCGTRGLRRLNADDSAGALRWLGAGEALVPEASPVQQLRLRLTEQGLLADNSPSTEGAASGT